MASPSKGCTPAGSDAPRGIPDFDMIRPIGRGGFGQVWLARNRTTGQLRAVKVIPLRGAGASGAAGREITSLTRLEAKLRRHPNLLTIHHVGKSAEHLFYVMDLADDLSGASASSHPDYRPATLESLLTTGPLAPQQCERYARQLLEGLASLHEAGMVHRDVKPANCLLVAGELKLADFGLLAEASPLISRVGTQKYMPPDGRMDARADVYAAGLAIYEIVTGMPADSFPRLGESAERLARTPTLCALTRLALRACQGDPQQRFQDARQMLAQLAADQSPAVVRCAAFPRRVAAWVAPLVLVLVIAVWAWWAHRPPLVDVNFATYPFEATIHLDGVVLTDAEGKAYTTPCTVDGLPARVHRVVFKHNGRPDLEMGPVDLLRKRQIVGRWDADPASE